LVRLGTFYFGPTDGPLVRMYVVQTVADTGEGAFGHLSWRGFFAVEACRHIDADEPA